MSKIFYIVLVSFQALFGVLAAQQLPSVEMMKFQPMDGGVVHVTADWYRSSTEPKGIFVLFHQAGSSRGEYTEIAQKLNREDYSCYAVDLRSGKTMNNVDNETYKEAKFLMKSTSYLDAYRDMETALKHIDRLNKDSLPVYVMGSSYSASLTIRLAASLQIPNLAGLILFSPGEYFINLNGQDNYIANFVAKLSVPIWASSTLAEAPKVERLFEGYENFTQFVPQSEGHHGAKALWSKYLSNEEYWLSMQSFYNSLP